MTTFQDHYKNPRPYSQNQVYFQSVDNRIIERNMSDNKIESKMDGRNNYANAINLTNLNNFTNNGEFHKS